MNRYRTTDIPVDGGDLRVGVWEPDGAPAAPVVLALHGVTASHRCWGPVADRLTGTRFVAPDLRGRGRSAELPGPYGMARHADDAVAVLDRLDIASAVVVGHSMGGFAAVALHHRHPDRVAGLVLVDGGLPLPPGPPGLTDAERTAALLGPAQARLSMTFPDRAAYRDFFRAHPAFADDWNDAVTDYVDYDLIGTAPALHAATPLAAVAADSADLGGDWLRPALAGLPVGTPLLRAPAGLLGERPGMYPPDWIAALRDEVPAVRVHDVAAVNHYTILFAYRGADAVAAAVRAAG